jgi:predicted  nucleic acid-binding Zn-ribbon protein
MEGILQKSTAIQSPQPQSPFEAYVIQQLKQLSRLDELGPMQEQLKQLGPMQEQLKQLAPMQEQLKQLAPMQEEISSIKKQLSPMQEQMGSMQIAIKELQHSVGDLSESIQFLADRMVTKEELTKILKNHPTKTDLAQTEYRIKSYIDEKIVNERLIPMMRKADEKTNSLIDTLEENKVIDRKNSQKIKSYGPFAFRA